MSSSSMEGAYAKAADLRHVAEHAARTDRALYGHCKRLTLAVQILAGASVTQAVALVVLAVTR